MKTVAVENCPVHGCQPCTIGSGIPLLDDLKHLEHLYVRHPYYVLHRAFPAAILFTHEFTIFCPECAKKNPFPSKRNIFGNGFMSQHSINEAKRNWNKACTRAYVRLVKNDLKI